MIFNNFSFVNSDFHGSWLNHTGLNAPLYRRLGETDSEAMLNQVYVYRFRKIVIFSLFKDFGVAIWLKNGAPAHKLVLGLPLFARTFLLASVKENDIRSPTIGNGTEGPYTRSPGFLSYFEVFSNEFSFQINYFLLFVSISRFVCYKQILNGQNDWLAMVLNLRTCIKIIIGFRTILLRIFKNEQLTLLPRVSEVYSFGHVSPIYNFPPL